MALIAYIGGVAVGVKRIRMHATGDNGIPGLSQNANGESAQGGIIFEDPGETMTITGWMPVVVEETACVGHERIFTGYIADRTYGRGAHYRAGGERQIDTTINDTMVLLQTDVFLSADGPNRPAETDTARMTWLLGTPPMDGRIFDLGLITLGVEHYDAASFLHQTPFDVLNDLCAARGNTFYTYWDDDEGKIGLFYDTPLAVTYTSDLSFSNVPGDLVLDSDGEPAGPVYFAYIDPIERIRNDEVYCRCIYSYTGGTVLVHNQTTHDYFFSTGGPGDVPEVGHRTIVVENTKVGKASTATSFANRLLEHYSVERQEVTFTARIRAADIGLIKPGMRTGLTFDHLPDLSTQQYYRVEQLTLSQSEGRRDWYDALITASVHGLGLPPGTGGGSTDVFPPAPPDDTPSVVQTDSGNSIGGGFEVSFDDPVSIGHVVVVASVWRDGATDDIADTNNVGTHNFVNFTQLGTGTIHSIAGQSGWLHARVVTADDFIEGDGTKYFFGTGAGSGRPKYLAWELAGVSLPGDTESQTNQAGASFSFGALSEVAGITIGMIGAGTDDPNPTVFNPNDHKYTNVGDSFWMTIFGIDRVTTAGSQVYSGSKGASGGDNTYMGVVANFPSAATTTPPRTGQPWGPILPNETPDGSRVDFSVQDGYTWAVNTLRVFVDHLDQTPALIAQDGVAGTFTLGFAPHVGDLVEVYGIGL